MRGKKARAIRKLVGVKDQPRSYEKTNTRIKTIQVEKMPHELDPQTGLPVMMDFTYMTHTRVSNPARRFYCSVKKNSKSLRLNWT